MRAQRKTYITRWSKRAEELEQAKAELKAGMSEHRRKVLDSKRILLFQEMLKDINYDDMNVVQELVDGATLTGEIPDWGSRYQAEASQDRH